MNVILYIEGDRSYQLMLSKLLISHGSVVVTATDGLDGVKKARELRPDMILMDLQLPRMDGLDVIMQLKGYSLTRGIPIVFVSALPTDYARQLVQETGAQDSVLKPFHATELLEVIQKNLPLS